MYPTYTDYYVVRKAKQKQENLGGYSAILSADPQNVCGMMPVAKVQ